MAVDSFVSFIIGCGLGMITAYAIIDYKVSERMHSILWDRDYYKRKLDLSKNKLKEEKRIRDDLMTELSFKNGEVRDLKKRLGEYPDEYK